MRKIAIFIGISGEGRSKEKEKLFLRSLCLLPAQEFFFANFFLWFSTFFQ
jgi:hypothetical protein